jgi:hypothetical protein
MAKRGAAAGPLVIVTHLAPSSRSLNPAESQELDTCIHKLCQALDPQSSSSYRIRETRVSHTRGYPDGRLIDPTFDPALVFEV